jgi:hypothetical protein
MSEANGTRGKKQEFLLSAAPSLFQKGLRKMSGFARLNPTSKKRVEKQEFLLSAVP